MDNDRKRGEELNQLSRLLFDKAANFWYGAALTQVIAGIFAAIIGLLTIPDAWKLPLAVFGFLLLGIAYFLSLTFEATYDTAETMRRQSVLTEALNWTISQTQFSEWRRKAGKSILKKFQLKPRDADYYTTRQRAGSRRLLEMTLESAFWTRHLYYKLQDIVKLLLIGAVGICILLISISPAKFIPADIHWQIVYAVYLLLPILLSINLLGWTIKLGRLAAAIKDIEVDIERLGQSQRLKEQQVMRLVSEYNCQLSSGFPIHPLLFNIWHDEIKNLWESNTN